MLCFIDAEWPLIGPFFATRGVRVLSARKLSKLLDGASGGVDDVPSVRARIRRAFPVA